MNTHLLARLEDRLREFISTEEVPYGGGLCGGGYDKPSFPSLYLNRSADPGLMKLPGAGSAMVRYKVKRREIDESREDGQPLYGASIEIQSLEPVAEEEEEGEELESTLFLKEFGSGGWRRMNRVGKSLEKQLRKAGVGGNSGMELRQKTMAPLFAKQGAKLRSAAPRIAKRADHGMLWTEKLRKAAAEQEFEEREFGSAGMGRLNRVSKSIYKKYEKGLLSTRGANMALRPVGIKETSKLESSISRMMKKSDANRRKKASWVAHAKKYGLPLEFEERDFEVGGTPTLLEFAEDRQRDGAGRFAAGGVPGPQDYLLAGAMAKRKKLATAGAGLGVLAGGAALARTEQGKMLLGRAGQSVLRAGGRMIG